VIGSRPHGAPVQSTDPSMHPVSGHRRRAREAQGRPDAGDRGVPLRVSREQGPNSSGMEITTHRISPLRAWTYRRRLAPKIRINAAIPF
jgi:hypothetical protein